jgi:hypothetical protein
MLSLILSISVSISPLESAIWQVETNQCEYDCPTGDNGNAAGPLQIWECAWSDVMVEGEVYSDCEGLDYSLEIFRRYMLRYATEERLGRTPTAQDKARIWNGGPNGYLKGSTKKYWNKVKEEIKPNP